MPFKTLIKIAISIVLLAYLFTLQDVSSSLTLLWKTHWSWLLYFIGLAMISQMLGAWRWQLLAQPLGFTLSFWNYLKYYLIGNFLCLFMPSSMGGDVGRLYALSKHCQKPKRLAAITLIFERLSGLLSLLGLTSIALLLPTTSDIALAVRHTAIWCSGAAIVGSILLCVLPNSLVSKLIPWNSVTQALNHYRNFKLILVCILIATLTHMVMIAIHIGIAQALSIHIAWQALIWIYGLVSLATVLPVSFNGIGIREGGYVLLLGSVGITSEVAMSFALYWFAVSLAIALLGGLPLLRGEAIPKTETERTS